MSRRRVFLLLGALVLLATGRPAAAAPAESEEFFLVSSLDLAHRRIVLKRPTEVTLLMRVTGETSYRDESGRRLAERDLRTGDTVYITYRQDPAGGPTARLIRRGPMTVQELARRYGIPAGPR
jgi:hypothetical protein